MTPQQEVRAELPAAQQKDDKQIAIIVSTLLQREHISKRRMDDEIFQSLPFDVLEDARSHENLFLSSRTSNTSSSGMTNLTTWFVRVTSAWGYTIFKTFLKRIDERVADRR